MLRVLTTAAISGLLALAVAGNAMGNSRSASTIPTDPVPQALPADELVSAEHDVIVEAEPVETLYEIDAYGKKVPYKCRSAKVAYVKKTLLGAVAYKWWMKRSWCWKPSSRIVSVGTSTYVTDMDGFNVYNGIIQAWGQWLEWCCDEPRSGHRAFRQAEFQNCIFKYGCLSTTYPWIKMTVRGDGTYAYSVGD